MKKPRCWHCRRRLRPWRIAWFNAEYGTTCWKCWCGFLTVKQTAPSEKSDHLRAGLRSWLRNG